MHKISMMYNALYMISVKYVQNRRVDLAQLVRFLVVELTHPGSNLIFDMSVTFMANYSFSRRRRSRQQ
jgi:hypothetical protein